ncbi:MAG TPA: ATPase, T2SS/T4P/T4SS family [Candidatus Omnitrophota bacterium]|nr:ATPase, T2SS/T4P/T4SS family [Candidatus Omnitrophota bacterium]
MLDDIQEEQCLAKLVEHGFLTDDQRAEVIGEQKKSGAKLAELLLRKKLISERDLTIFFSQEFGVPVMNPLTFVISKDILDLIPKNIVKRYQIVPISCLDRSLTIATSNPIDLMMLDDLAALTGYRIKAVLAMPSLLSQAIEKFYGEQSPPQEPSVDVSLEEILGKMDKDPAAVKPSKAFEAHDLAKEAESNPTIRITNLLLVESVIRRASDLFVEPWEKNLRVRCRVDGVLEEVKTLPPAMGQGITSRIKVMSNLDIAERRIPQDGRFKARIQNREIDFRVSIIPTYFGEKTCIRLLDTKSQAHGLDTLGFSEDELAKLRAAALRPHGMILVTGPTGSGKTTTLYSVLNLLHTPEKNITTVEDPVEYQVAGINQVNVREGVGLTFAASLRSILRQDPNVVMIGEIRDLETMDIAIKAALTGHLVLSTLHTNDAASSVIRMVNMGIEPFLIASSVILVTGQRLVRRLCVNCKEPFDPPEEIRTLLKIPSGAKKRIYKSVGCSSCRNTGFTGRRVITEVLQLSSKVRELILKRATAEEIKNQARLEGMTTLRESGFRKVVDGETTVEEVLRITMADEDLKHAE